MSYNIRNKNIRIVITLTTIPSRLQYIKETLDSLTKQTILPHQIYLFLPKYSSKEKCEYPNINFNEYPLVKIFKPSNDYGPITKLYPILEIEKSLPNITTLVITIDDDSIYDPRLVECLVNGWLDNCNSNDVACLSGIIVGHNLLDSWITIDDKLPNNIEVDWPQGVKGVIYPLDTLIKAGERLIQFKEFGLPEAFFADDLWVGGVLSYFCQSKIIKISPSKNWKFQSRPVAKVMALHRSAYNNDDQNMNIFQTMRGIVQKMLLNRRVALGIREKLPGAFQTKISSEIAIERRFADDQKILINIITIAVVSIITLIILNQFIFKMNWGTYFLIVIFIIILFLYYLIH